MSEEERQRLLDHPGGTEDQGPFVPPSTSRRINSVHRTWSHVRKDVSRNFLRNTSADYINAPNSWNIRWALVAILLSVVLERVTYYGLVGNLVLFLNKDPFVWESFHAMGALLIFFAINYIMSLIGGWIADSLLGRFKTMVLAYVIYICGFGLLPFIAQKSYDTGGNFTIPPEVCFASHAKQRGQEVDSPFKEECATLIYLTLTVIAIGNGILRANICPFGSDQLVRANQHTQLSFFNWFYWCVNIGSFIGLGGMTYIEQQDSFYVGYIVCFTTLVASGFVFCLGRVCYVSRPPDGSVLTNVFRIIGESLRRRRQGRQLRRQEGDMQHADGSHGEAGDEGATNDRTISFLDHAKQRYGGIFDNSLVDDVKMLGMILAVFAVLIPYWIVYFQMQTSFLTQGLHMRLDFYNVNRSEFDNACSVPYQPQIVAAWLSLFDAVFVIILLPLFDRVVYPRLARAGYPFTFAKRMVLGMLFAIGAMIFAGIVEHLRLNSFWPHPDAPCTNASVTQCIGETMYEAADMSVFWQIPQYALIGISEVFASVAGLQFAVTVAPKSMKAIITGLFYFSAGIGSLTGTAVLAALAETHTWFFKVDYGNINCRIGCSDVPPQLHESCHLDYYFYLLAGFETVGLLLFLWVAWVFGLNTDELVMNARVREETEEGTSTRHLQRHNSSPSTS